MLINFNINSLNDLLYDFYKITGLTISIWDTSFKQLAFQPKKIAEFCKIIKSSSIGAERCFNSDKHLCLLCKKLDNAVSHRCHAGLIDTAVPLTYSNILLGYIMFGQVIDNNISTSSFNEVKLLCDDLNINKKKLEEAYYQLQYFSQDTIISASHIIKVIAKYLYLSDLIKIKNNDLATEIDNYLTNNLSTTISVKDICALFCISKNKLYAIAERWYDMPIGKYISSKRVDLAKTILLTSDKPIYEICTEVGIPDYNYFSKVFKKFTNTTPQKYRHSNSIVE